MLCPPVDDTEENYDNIVIIVYECSAVATVEATEAAASVKILTGAIIISVIKITFVTFNANSTI